jgi:hypothetical protein
MVAKLLQQLQDRYRDIYKVSLIHMHKLAGLHDTVRPVFEPYICLFRKGRPVLPLILGSVRATWHGRP